MQGRLKVLVGTMPVALLIVDLARGDEVQSVIAQAAAQIATTLPPQPPAEIRLAPAFRGEPLIINGQRR